MIEAIVVIGLCVVFLFLGTHCGVNGCIVDTLKEAKKRGNNNEI